MIKEFYKCIIYACFYFVDKILLKETSNQIEILKYGTK